MLDKASLVAILLLQSQCYASENQQWRDESRKARVAVEHEEFGQAVSGYKRAIAMLQAESPGSEAALDLELALVETYRRQGNFETARRLLEQIGAKLEGIQPEDPMLVARYFRWRSLLLANLGDRAGSAESYRQSLAVVGKHFDLDSKYYAENWRDTLMQLMRAQQWESVAEELARLRSQSKSFDRLPSLMQKEFTLAVAQARSAAFSYSKAGQLDKAGNMLKQLTGVDPDNKAILDLWIVWSECCYKLKQPAKTVLAVEQVNKLLAEIAGSKTRENLHAEISGHACLAGIYQRQQETEKTIDQYQKIADAAIALGPGASLQEALLSCPVLDESARARIDKQLFDDQTLRLLRQEVQLTGLPKVVAKATHDTRLSIFHCWSRCQLASVLDQKREWPEALRNLSGINARVVAQSDRPMVWQCRINLRIGSIYRQTGNVESARHHLQLAKSFYERVPPSKLKDGLKMKIAELSQQIAAEKAQPAKSSQSSSEHPNTTTTPPGTGRK